MLKYAVKRMLQMFLALLVFSLVAYGISELPPGDLASIFDHHGVMINYGRNPDWDAIRAAEGRVHEAYDEYWFERPFFPRYYRWISKILLQGEWGYAFSWDQPVRALIGAPLVGTLLIVFLTLFLSWLFAIPLGTALLVRQRSVFDMAVTWLCRLGIAIPVFLIVICLVRVTPSLYGESVRSLFSETHVNASWIGPRIEKMLEYWGIPILALLVGAVAHNCLVIRQRLSHSSVMRSDCSLQNPKLIWRYRISLVALLDRDNLVLPKIISSVVLVDIVLLLQRTSTLFYHALYSGEQYLVASLLFLLGAVSIVGTTLTDILRAALDPRVRAEL